MWGTPICAGITILAGQRPARRLSQLYGPFREMVSHIRPSHMMRVLALLTVFASLPGVADALIVATPSGTAARVSQRWPQQIPLRQQQREAPASASARWAMQVAEPPVKIPDTVPPDLAPTKPKGDKANEKGKKYKLLLFNDNVNR